MSKVLIIGNGFDIYHGLPTRYNDFLFMAEHWNEFYEGYEKSAVVVDKNKLITVCLDKGKLCKDSFDDYWKHKNIFDDAHIQYLNEHITTNAWIKYFLEKKFNGKGWVDFEAEIDNVLSSMDLFFEQLPLHVGTLLMNSQIITSDIRSIARSFLPLTQDKYDCGFFGRLSSSLVEPPKLREHKLYLIEKLKEELNILNECLRLYLLEFVEPIKCNVCSEQINDLGDVNLLNFNYTYTYKKVYGNLRNTHHPIHGDCLNGGMVLGIPDDSFRNKLEYIYFVKYFQRIQKRAGSFYKEWIQEPDVGTRTLSDIPCEVYIMGHSLAETDKGILEDFFRNDWIEKITIFYHSQTSYEDMIINLVAMFGKDFVISQTGYGRIVFEKLDPPVALR